MHNDRDVIVENEEIPMEHTGKIHMPEYGILLGNMNQLANVHNFHQGKAKKVLFLCSAGLLRSATAAHTFSAEPYNFNTRTAGVAVEYALNPVSVALLEWADQVFLMNRENEYDLIDFLGETLYKDFAEKIVVLDVPDRYSYRHPGLVAELIKQVEPHLPS